jgi:hypothetical protein
VVDASCPKCEARKVEGFLNRAEQVLAIVILQVVAPLIPLGIEYLYKNRISDAGMVLTAATFAMATARTSQRVGILIAGLVAGAGFSLVYGAAAYGNAPIPAKLLWSAKMVVILSAVTAIVERFIRHGLEGERALVYRGLR